MCLENITTLDSPLTAIPTSGLTVCWLRVGGWLRCQLSTSDVIVPTAEFCMPPAELAPTIILRFSSFSATVEQTFFVSSLRILSIRDQLSLSIRDQLSLQPTNTSRSFWTSLMQKYLFSCWFHDHSTKTNVPKRCSLLSMLVALNNERDAKYLFSYWLHDHSTKANVPKHCRKQTCSAVSIELGGMRKSRGRNHHITQRIELLPTLTS